MRALLSLLLGFVIGTVSSIWVHQVCQEPFCKKRHPFSHCPTSQAWYWRIPIIRYGYCSTHCMYDIPFCTNECLHALLFLCLSAYHLPLFPWLLYAGFFSLSLSMAMMDRLCREVPVGCLVAEAILCFFFSPLSLLQMMLQQLLLIVPLWLWQRSHPEAIGSGDILYLACLCLLFPLPRCFLLILLACLLSSIELLIEWKHKPSSNLPHPFFPSLTYAMCLLLLTG